MHKFLAFYVVYELTPTISLLPAASQKKTGNEKIVVLFFLGCLLLTLFSYFPFLLMVEQDKEF